MGKLKNRRKQKAKSKHRANKAKQRSSRTTFRVSKARTSKQYALDELDEQIESKKNIIRCAETCKYSETGINRKRKELELLEKERELLALA